ncbi:MAG: hypothetical protein MUF10_10710 [Thermoanaerobaculaceae bacterium]|nr:hypothetical protein [Thermoanaerobaculaceae bacterium]
MAPGEARFTPAQAVGWLHEQIRAAGWPIEVRIDVHWIFLRERGFKIAAFGDVSRRERSLGKWIVDLEPGHILEAAAKVLPSIGHGTIQLAKLSNVFNIPRPRPVLVAYCLDRDGAVREALEALGWHPRFKLNRETSTGRSGAGSGAER